jgi:hypothetical protein
MCYKHLFSGCQHGGVDEVVTLVQNFKILKNMQELLQ